MLLSCKRVPTYHELLLEPLWKRCRLDGPIPEPDDSSGAACSSDLDPHAIGAVLDRRRSQIDDLQEEPTCKRFRTGDIAGPHEDATIRGWAEEIVRALHGCPSVEEAAQRCSRALVEFSAEVRQAALREAEPVPGVEQAPPEMRPEEERTPEGQTQSLQHTNKVLMRAVHHLAERCRKMEAAAAEVPALQQALEQSQEVQRRLVHSNEVLQEHIKVHLNACR
mmetsp:Transcript_9319/g.21918  ORF Transcript_9319/g.21918 Transcript_9319/m.21918 type:complete len:222 (+) Transcript_9319:91-756(+)